MTDCALCEENPRYLGGNESLGRCICVTPEAMLALDQLLEENSEREVRICETLRLADDAALEDRIESYVSAVDGVFSDVTAGRLKAGDPDELRKTVDEALNQAYEDGGASKAAEALQDYLCSINLPASPTGATGNAALDVLIALVL